MGQAFTELVIRGKDGVEEVAPCNLSAILRATIGA